MANKINPQTNPIFQFTELTPKEYETMPENGLYILRCKLPDDDWAGSCKKDMEYDLTKQIRLHGIGNWGKDGGFHVSRRGGCSSRGSLCRIYNPTHTITMICNPFCWSGSRQIELLKTLRRLVQNMQEIIEGE